MGKQSVFFYWSDLPGSGFCFALVSKAIGIVYQIAVGFSFCVDFGCFMVRRISIT
jgi:hypothetical protein